MIKTAFVLFVGNIICAAFPAAAQISNGMFTDGYTDWTLVGLASTATPDKSDPPPGSLANAADALISSTSSAYEGDPTNAANSATADQLQMAFGDITLPGSNGDPTVVDGQAIYQTFNLTAPGTLTFEYKTSSHDFSVYDRVGYILQDPSSPMNSDFHGLANNSGGYVAIAPIVLTAGTYKLGFIAYNTGDNFSATQIQVGDVEVATVPEPGVWLLLALGVGSLIFAQRGLPGRSISRA